MTRSVSLRLADKVMGPIFGLAVPSKYIKAEELARFCLEAGKGHPEPGTFSNAQMKERSREWNEAR